MQAPENAAAATSGGWRREKSAAAWYRRRGIEARTAERGDDIVVLGADTTVVVDGEILGKPRDDGDARRMLRRLSGRAHEVMTGISLRHGGVRGRPCRNDGVVCARR